MVGNQVGHYKILEKLGSGGMGEVWLAEDTRLKRRVALKFLPAEAATEDEQARFIREAQAASALDHPNICTIYEAGDTDDDRTYIAMAYCDGETVKEKISKGPLDLEEALDIAIQIGEGLARAHREGIVHRDIKPANAILTKDGTIKIVDFGLAKLTGSTQLTKTGTSMGTAAYMSPEQIRGEGVDHGTDIWALGVMLYEMVTGEQPFKGENETALTYAILNDEPENIITIRDDIPPQIDSVIGKALVKDPANRFQHVQEMIEELRNLPIGGAGLEGWEKSIVVLPFENMSPDPEQEFFSDGLTEEIITDLSKIHSLRVISRNSAMMLKGTRKATKTIGRELNVQYVLEGSVRRAGNDLRITAQLIDATTDAHLWAEKYSGTLDDVFDIQEKVSRSIVDALELTLSPEANKEIAKRPIPDVYAYECYLKARYEIWKWTEDGLNNALEHLQNGLNIVGDNAYLLAGIGYVNYQYVNTGLQVDELYLQRAEEYAKRALELDPESPYGNIVLGLRQGSWGGNPKAGIEHFKRALAVVPNDYDALVWIYTYYAHFGKTDEATPFLERLIRIEPLDPRNQLRPGLIQMWSGRFDRAQDILQKVYESHPDDLIIRWYYALTLSYNHLIDEACALFESAAKEAPGVLFFSQGLLLAYALQVKESEVISLLESSELHYWARRNPAYSLYVAESYALINEKEKALEWLEIAISRGMINYPFLNEYDPHLENIRGDERFHKLMERVKHEWETFEV